MFLTEDDATALRLAVEQLEFPGVAERLYDVLGKPIEKVIAKLPARVQNRLSHVIHEAMQKALDFVLLTMDIEKPWDKPRDRTHKWLALSTGFVGGFFGGWTALAEIPVTTGLMLRSIADIARSEGEDLSHPEARLQCVLVLGMNPQASLRRSDSSNPPIGVGGYYAVRNGMAAMVDEAVRVLATSTAAHPSKTFGPSVLVSFLNTVGQRYGLILSEELLLQWMPVIGGLGGASVNYVFAQHFQKLAHGHFTVRRLERQYGAAVVRDEYEAIRVSLCQERDREKHVFLDEVAATLSRE